MEQNNTNFMEKNTTYPNISKNISKNIFNIFGYIFFLIILIFFINKESDDLFSNKDRNKKETEFGDGYGKYLFSNKFQLNDSSEIIRKKIENLSNFQETLPKWRRSLGISVLITLLISLIFYKKLISFNKFLMYIIICFVVINFSFSFYSYHYDKYAIEYIKENLKHLK